MHYPTTIAGPGGTIEASVLIAGTPQSLYRRADGRMFVAGVPGSPYTVRVRNLTSARVEVILGIDGRHALSDDRADPHANRGMVLTPHQYYDFRGWRVSDAQTREFLFGNPATSVAAQAGSTANIGVIGIAAWQERDYGLEYASVATASAGHPQARGLAASGFESHAAGSLGTGIGSYQDDRVVRTDFIRASGEPEILVIGYDTEAGLIRRGITFPADPDPFPGRTTGYENYTTPAT